MDTAHEELAGSPGWFETVLPTARDSAAEWDQILRCVGRRMLIAAYAQWTGNGCLLSREDCQDVTQKAMVEIDKRREEFCGLSAAEFLGRCSNILRTRMIDHHRSAKRKFADSLTSFDRGDEGRHSDLQLLPDDPVRRRWVEQGMAKMSQSDREILEMYFWEGMSLREIAEKRSTSEEAAKKAHQRARARLRDVLTGAQANAARE